MAGVEGALMTDLLMVLVIGTVMTALAVDLIALAAWIRRQWQWD
jgi:hypothetical protein